MAYETGTADDYLDLLDRLRLFVSTDSDLVSAGQEWDVLDWGGAVPGTELYLRGQGLAGQDNIFVGIRAYENPVADWFNWAIRPFLGWIDVDSWSTQPGAGPERGLPLWDQSIPYWFAANGRRIIVAAQISTVYQVCHLGLARPYATPLQNQLPLLVAGTMPAANEWRWSNTDTNHRFFTHGGAGTLRPLRYIEGSWLTNLDTFPHSQGGVLRETWGGTYPLEAIVLSNSDLGALVEIDGLYWIPGFANAAGNTFEIDGDDYVVLQNVFRTGNNDYLAMRLA